MTDLVLLLVILNPFAQLIYLFELMNQFEPGEFRRLHLKATILSFIVFVIFALLGDLILKHIFQVRLPSLQIFGGFIMLFIAYRYISQGAGSNLLFKGNISELAPQISLPYMVGPGTLWAAILIGRRHSIYQAILIIATVLLINFFFVALYQYFHYNFEVKRETRFGKYFAILMRTNALFIGAVAVEMVIMGMENILTDSSGSVFGN